jgi:two-component system response regulator VicR
MDEDVLYGLVEYKLKKSGYDVTRASDGKQTLELLRAETFDALLLDVMLQKVDGFTVLRELRKEGTAIPGATIVLSARADEQDVLSAFELGAVDYMSKPFSLNILAERLRLAMRAPVESDGYSYTELVEQPAEPVGAAQTNWSIES